MKTGLSFLVLPVLALAGASASADEAARPSAQVGEIVPFARLLDIARKRVGREKLLDAVFATTDDRATMELFFLGENGRVLSVLMDARTAAVIDRTVDPVSGRPAGERPPDREDAGESRPRSPDPEGPGGRPERGGNDHGNGGRGDRNGNNDGGGGGRR